VRCTEQQMQCAYSFEEHLHPTVATGVHANEMRTSTLCVAAVLVRPFVLIEKALFSCPSCRRSTESSLWWRVRAFFPPVNTCCTRSSLTSYILRRGAYQRPARCSHELHGQREGASR
jgi:hypothetical protein